MRSWTVGVFWALLTSVVIVGAGAGCFGSGVVVCPDGWSYDRETSLWCEPSHDELEAIRAEVGTGAYGWVRLIEGGCGPGDGTCMVEAVAMHPLAFISIAPGAWCVREELAAISEDELLAHPSTTTDERGVYSIPLAPGLYCVVSDDILTGERVVSRVEVIGGRVVAHDVKYDHGRY